jgi:hypothetical protein
MNYSFSSHFLLQHFLEGIRNILVATALVEFVLEFDPMQSQAMQEALQHVHAHQHKECE